MIAIFKNHKKVQIYIKLDQYCVLDRTKNKIIVSVIDKNSGCVLLNNLKHSKQAIKKKSNKKHKNIVRDSNNKIKESMESKIIDVITLKANI
tara:strand:- start:1416 stop:1691 length:276 start_codon:yes stop_codon:yes gene_type:complete